MHYSDEVKRQAVAAILAGASIRSQAKATGADKTTVEAWLKRASIPKKASPTHRVSAKESVVIAVPDLHCPWLHQDALRFICYVRDKFQATDVILLGDEIDAHGFSKWPKDPDVFSPGHELKAAIESLIPWYVEFPKMRVCVSNHSIRPHKVMKSVGLPQALWPTYSTILNAPDGWTWHEHIIIDNVRYMHGDQGKGGVNGWTKNSEVYHQSTVVGHWHSKAGVYYDSKLFNLNAGCLIDPTAPVFDYAKHSHKKPNLGCGMVIGGEVAHFIPMRTDHNGRWLNRL